MKTEKLAGLQPASVFYYFEKICSMPHGSGNTKQISDYLKSFADEHGIKCVQDELNNILMFAPGTPGYEDHAPVILQGHMDMVCDKDADCTINMDSEGLDITHDGEYVFARGTTLGGDDGIALACILALLADKTIAHPPIEAVITVDEETGMYGAAGIDLSKLKGRTLINIDSEEEGIFTVACAGGIRSTISLPLERRAVYGPCVRVSIEGLQGGHSGVEIHKNRANANKIMGMLLARIQEKMPICITSLSGGAKDNAIAHSAQATMVTLGNDPACINEIIDTLQAEIRAQFEEPTAVVHGENVDALGGNAVTTECTAKLIAMLNAVPNGVQAWSQDIEGLVQTSLNLGVMGMDDTFRMTFAVRSSVNEEKRELVEKLKAIAAEFGADYSETGDYPAWEYKKDSVLRDTMVETYRQMYGKEPKVVAIHAGLECGLLSEKLPGLDCVSIGPEMHDIHTSREKLGIASTERVWNYLQEVLKKL